MINYIKTSLQSLASDLFKFYGIKFYYAETLAEMQMACPPPDTQTDIYSLKLCNLRQSAKMLDILKSTKKALKINNIQITSILNIHTEAPKEINNNRKYVTHRTGARAYVYYNEKLIITKNKDNNTFYPPINIQAFAPIMAPIEAAFLPAFHRDVYTETIQPNYKSSFAKYVNQIKSNLNNNKYNNNYNNNQEIKKHNTNNNNNNNNLNRNKSPSRNYNYTKNQNTNNNNSNNNNSNFNYNNINNNDNNNNNNNSNTSNNEYNNNKHNNSFKNNHINNNLKTTLASDTFLNKSQMHIDDEDDQQNKPNIPSQLIVQPRNVTFQTTDEITHYNPINQIQELINTRLSAIEMKVNMNTTQTNLLATRLETIESNTIAIATNLIEKQNQDMKAILTGFLTEQQRINNQNRNSN